MHKFVKLERCLLRKIFTIVVVLDLQLFGSIGTFLFDAIKVYFQPTVLNICSELQGCTIGHIRRKLLMLV